MPKRSNAALLLALAVVFLSTPALADTASAIQAYKAGQFEQSLREFEIEAGKGDPVAQAAAGSQYLEGKGVARDLDKARYWLLKAAAQGNVFAKYSWTETIGKRGKMLEPGDVKEDPDAVFDQQGKLLAYKVGNVVFPVPAGFRGPRILPPRDSGAFGVMFASTDYGASAGTAVRVWMMPDIPPIFRPALRAGYLNFAKDQIAEDLKRFGKNADGFSAQPLRELTIANVPAASVTFSKPVNGADITTTMIEFALGDTAVEFQIDAHGTVNADEVQAATHAIESVRFEPAFPTPPETWMPAVQKQPAPSPAAKAPASPPALLYPPAIAQPSAPARK